MPPCRSLAAPPRLLLALATLALLATAGGCGRKPAQGRRAPLREPGVAEVTDEMRAFVRTAKVGESKEARRAEVTFFGKVGFNEDHLHYAPIGAPVTGRVVRVMVEPGDRVKAQQPLLAIHSPDLAGAQASLHGSTTERERASLRLARAERLVDAGAGAQSELEEARTSLVRSEQEELRARQALVALGSASGGAELVIVSPISGTVVSRKAGAGAVVHPDSEGPVVVVADLAKVWVHADVPEADLGDVHVGQQASITVQSSTRVFSGVVTRIANQVEPDTHTVPVRVEVANEVDPAASAAGAVGYLLKPDMYATIAMDVSSTSRVVVPLSAVLTRRDEFFVFVKGADGKFRERRVRPGATIHGDEVALLQEPGAGGISIGDEIVVEGAILLDAEANEPLATQAPDAGPELATGGAHR